MWYMPIIYPLHVYISVIVPCPADTASFRGKWPVSQDNGPDQQKKARTEAPNIPSIMEQRATHICNRVREFSAKICGQLKITQFDENTIPRPTQFGDMKQELPKRKYLSARSFASNPWMRGFAPPMPTSSTTSEMLESYIRQMPTEELKRFNLFLQHPFIFCLLSVLWFASQSAYISAYNIPSLWIDHLEPRLARVDSITVRKQLVGDHGLDHELGTVLIRRWAQMDRELNMEWPYITYKHVLEPDFSVSSFFMLSTHPHHASGIFIFYGEGL
jgi:hypothetical protein